MLGSTQEKHVHKRDCGKGADMKTKFIRSFNLFAFCFYKVYHIFVFLLEIGCLSGLEIKLIHDENGPSLMTQLGIAQKSTQPYAN